MISSYVKRERIRIAEGASLRAYFGHPILKLLYTFRIGWVSGEKVDGQAFTTF